MTLEPTIVAKQLNHYYGEGHLRRQILFNIDFQIQPGKIVIMTGPSGSGKTTLLTLVGGLRSVQEGSLQVLGQEMRGASNQRLQRIRRQIGFIFQAHNLLSSLSTIENVQMSTALYPVSLSESLARSQAALESVGLGNYLQARPDQLSGGQKQRVAIARALVNKPQIVLADEPTASLDRATGREVVELMQQLSKQQGCTIVLVTHDNRILDIADHIISLEDGHLLTSKGELLLNLSNLTSFIVETDINQIKDLISPLSAVQFSEFLGKLNRELEQIVSTVNLLGSRSFDLKLQVTIQAISFKIAQLLDAEQVTFFVVDRAKQTLWSKNARGKHGELISIEIPIDAGIAGYVATTGENLNIPNPYHDPRFNPQIDKDTGFQTRSILCLPIMDSKNEVFAVVQALNKRGDAPFDRQDEERFFDLTQSLGFAVKSSILYAQRIYSSVSQTLGINTSELKAKVTAFSMIQFIDFLSDLNQEFEPFLTSGLTLENPVMKEKIQELLQVISFKIAQVLEAEVTTLFIVNRETQTLRADNLINKDGKLFTIEIPIKTGIAGYVARTGKSIIINDPYHDARFNPEVDRDTGFRTRNILSLPIFDPSTHEVVAVVQALNKSTSRVGFDTEDQHKFLELIDVLGVVLQTSIRSLQTSFTYC